MVACNDKLELGIDFGERVDRLHKLRQTPRVGKIATVKNDVSFRERRAEDYCLGTVRRVGEVDSVGVGYDEYGGLDGLACCLRCGHRRLG